MASTLVPRAVALGGGAQQPPSPKRRKTDAPDAGEAARREWGPPQFARTLPALYTRDCSTAAEAAAIASGEPLPAAPKQATPPRPNHFLALQVSHEPAVVAAIQRVQGALSKHSPHLKKACVEAASSHLTLDVMALQGEEDIAAAREAMGQLGALLQKQGLMAPLELNLAGLSHFNNQVLYLDVTEGEGLQQLLAVAAAVRDHFASTGLLRQADRPFVPHVTIAKLSKLPRGGRGGWGQRGKGSHGREAAAGGWHDKGKAQGRGERERGGKKGRRRERGWRGDFEAAMLAEGEGEGGEAIIERACEEEEEEQQQQLGGNDARQASMGRSSPSLPDGIGNIEVEANGLEAEGVEVHAWAKSPEGKALGAALAGDCTGPKGCGVEVGQEGDRGHGDGADCSAAAGEEGGAVEGEEALAGSNRARGRGSRGGGGAAGGIPPEAYAALAEISGGVVRCAEVQLCRMQGRRPGEYYQVLASVALVGANAGEGVAAAAEATVAAASSEG